MWNVTELKWVLNRFFSAAVVVSVVTVSKNNIQAWLTKPTAMNWIHFFWRCPIYLLFVFGCVCLDEFNQIKVSSLVNKLKTTHTKKTTMQKHKYYSAYKNWVTHSHTKLICIIVCGRKRVAFFHHPKIPKLQTLCLSHQSSRITTYTYTPIKHSWRVNSVNNLWLLHILFNDFCNILNLFMFCVIASANKMKSQPKSQISDSNHGNNKEKNFYHCCTFGSIESKASGSGNLGQSNVSVKPPTIRKKLITIRRKLFLENFTRFIVVFGGTFRCWLSPSSTLHYL